MKNKHNLYKGLLNTDLFVSLRYAKAFRWLKFIWLMMVAFSILGSFLLCMFGIRIDFAKSPENIFYIFALVFTGLTIVNALIFILISLKIKLFKKKNILLAITFSPIIAIIVSFAFSFAAIPYQNDGGEIEYNVIIPLIYIVLIALPALFMYIYFSYYAFIEQIQKIMVGKINQDIIQNKIELEQSKKELKEQIFQNITYKYHASKVKEKEEDK